jgi:holo-[acyl-carrier protein] synthase
MIGIDVVDIERFRDVLERSPWLEKRLFTDEERSYCNGRADPVRHFASTFAAKEAVVKATAMGSVPAAIRRVKIARDRTGCPTASIDARHEHEVVVSLSHERGLAIAMAMATTQPSS